MIDRIQYANPEVNGGGGWGIFNAILGWQNSATVGSVVSYCLYWVVIIAAFFTMRYRESKGHLPFTKAKQQVLAHEELASSGDDATRGSAEKKAIPQTTRTVSESSS